MKIMKVSISFLRLILATSQRFYVKHFSLLLFSKYSLIIGFSSFCFRKWLHLTVKSIDQTSKEPAFLRHSWACLRISSLNWFWFITVIGIPLRTFWPLLLKNKKLNWASPLMSAVCLQGCVTFLRQWVASCF